MTVDEAKAILHKRNLRATKQRIQLLQFLSQNRKPLSLTEIHTHGNLDMDESTIFRNLETFVLNQLVSKYLIDSGTTHYEYTPDGSGHHHVICTNCHRIEELPVCPIKDISSITSQVSSFTQISSHQLCFYGTCTSCANM